MKKHKRRKARELRRNGLSVRAITKEVNCAKSSVSLWVRDIEITPTQAACLKSNMSRTSNRDGHLCAACGEEYTGRQCVCKKSSHTCGRCGQQHKSGRICACRSAKKCTLCGREHRTTTLRCPACITRIRRIRGKLAAITYLGGKCQNTHCPARGRKIHPSGFEFHHRYGKDFSIGTVHNRSWKSFKEELDKCVLLCSICHREQHATRFDDEALIREARKLANNSFDLEIDWSLLP